MRNGSSGKEPSKQSNSIQLPLMYHPCVSSAIIENHQLLAVMATHTHPHTAEERKYYCSMANVCETAAWLSNLNQKIQ
jgi:hypothetical protein